MKLELVIATSGDGSIRRSEREKFDGRERLIVVPGNRLILWAIMDYRSHERRTC